MVSFQAPGNVLEQWPFGEQSKIISAQTALGILKRQLAHRGYS